MKTNAGDPKAFFPQYDEQSFAFFDLIFLPIDDEIDHGSIFLQAVWPFKRLVRQTIA
jgi:hypothetical protein